MSGDEQMPESKVQEIVDAVNAVLRQEQRRRKVGGLRTVFFRHRIRWGAIFARCTGCGHLIGFRAAGTVDWNPVRWLHRDCLTRFLQREFLRR